MLKLLILDMDGTLIDTSYINYHAYNEALSEYGYSVEHEFFAMNCSGRHYKEFLPELTCNDEKIIEAVHEKKKLLYAKYLNKGRLNETLISMVRACKKQGMKVALVTTANKKNVIELLNCFELIDDFDLILTQDDVIKQKPDPYGFIAAMKHFGVKPEQTLIFEDSPTGIEAAKASGADYMQVYNYR